MLLNIEILAMEMVIEDVDAPLYKSLQNIFYRAKTDTDIVQFQILDWDSAFFGMRVARILPNRLTTGELDQMISHMRDEKVALAYWASDPNDEESQRAARVCHGFPAGNRTTFVMDLHQNNGSAENLGAIVEEYTDAVPNSELEQLAVEAGVYSRFRVDRRIPAEKFSSLYKQWIRNSTNKRMADAVLVVRHAGKIVGMVTVKERNGAGDIGLIAVDADMRGHKLGISLVRAAQEWSRKRGLKLAQVVTQGENTAACRLYEKCGYKVTGTENFYHFWIR